MMGSAIDRKLQALEDAFGDELRALEPPDADDLARRLFGEAYRRLSLVEKFVMDELMEAYRSRPGLSPAGIWRELTEAQRAMENEWRTKVRTTAHEMLDADPGLPDGRREALKRDVTLAVGNAPFWRGANRGVA
ncbi:MAG: hypothetical protein M3P49_06680 [Actinomycetota bacterium]|nr:hypothetical protein [Actinomycetota bacterium]